MPPAVAAMPGCPVPTRGRRPPGRFRLSTPGGALAGGQPSPCVAFFHVQLGSLSPQQHVRPPNGRKAGCSPVSGWPACAVDRRRRSRRDRDMRPFAARLGSARGARLPVQSLPLKRTSRAAVAPPARVGSARLRGGAELGAGAMCGRHAEPTHCAEPIVPRRDPAIRARRASRRRGTALCR
jgi:hypothetical protein